MEFRVKSYFPLKYAVKFLIFAALLFIFFYFKKTDDLYHAVYDSYTAVGIFVAMTLTTIYLFEHYTHNAMLNFLIKHQKLQVPVATMLGVLPGCGGSIIVVTQYAKGYVTFGSMVATLIATMGDAAILLLQRKPAMAFLLFAIVGALGMVMGYAIDFFYKENKYAKPKPIKTNIPEQKGAMKTWAEMLWIGLFIVNAVLYFTPSSFQADPTVAKIIRYVNILGVIYTIILWIFKSPNHSCDEPSCRACSGVFNKVAIEVSFIITWILIGMLLYKSLDFIASIDIISIMGQNVYWMPLIAAVVGLIPGCGPQILVTTLYVNGAIPFAAQIANAISNDGDALMPAIAMRPKQALVATVYGFIPALAVGYLILFFTI